MTVIDDVNQEESNYTETGDRLLTVTDANVDGRNNVQIYVEGTYTNAESQTRITGSLRCFTILGKDSFNQ